MFEQENEILDKAFVFFSTLALFIIATERMIKGQFEDGIIILMISYLILKKGEQPKR